MTSKVISILSIDLDYAYSPVIAAYDDFVEGSRISFEAQQSIFIEHGLPEPRVNPVKLEYLRQVLKAALNANPVSIAEGQHHHEILDFLDRDAMFSIVNVDHHHDIFYPGWHDPSELDEGNWVNWLARNQQIHSYTWVRNSDSENLDPDVDVSFPYTETEWLNPAELPLFHQIFVCTSPHWTGDQHLTLLHLLEA